ncbi:MAG: hypothetical protein KDD61_09145 [Bdellovibrionales bacterium]|nr:hypothetical protein [Bdellovibrionales bacterium]
MSKPEIRRRAQIGFGTPNDSSILETFSTTQGSRPWPTMTESQRDAISSPAEGLTIFNSDTSKINIYSGSSWGDLSGGSGDWTYTAKTTTYTAATNDFINANATSGGFTITLPASSGNSGKRIGVRKSDSSSNAVTVDGNSSETINGYLTYVLKAQNDVIYIESDGTNWLVVNSQIQPTIQTFTSGSGTYTTPNGTKYIRVRMVGGGGGGAGSGTSGGSGGATTASTFGSSLLSAGGGGSATGGAGSGAAGGSSSLGTGPIGIALTGGSGGGSAAAVNIQGGQGGSSAFGGGGGGGVAGPGAGLAAAANTGGGGGGAGMGGSGGSAGGGGAGGYVDAIINNPSSSYSYVVGTGGTGGTAGTGGAAGGAGAAGIIIVEEYY